MKAKFSVGEKVILQSTDYPEYNGGPYLITDNMYGVSIDAKTQEVVPPTNLYRLDATEDAWWTESSLRKYYPPADYSFRELMDELNINLTKEK